MRPWFRGCSSGLQKRGGEEGMALVLALACIAFLVALTLQLMGSVDRQWSATAAQREQVRLEGLVQGGLDLARAALFFDQHSNAFDSLFDAWNTLDRQKIQALAGEEAQLGVAVADLSGRLQVNALGRATGRIDAGTREAKALQRYRELWRRFLASGRFAIGRDEIEPLLDALADWVDKDRDERALGAEDAFYQAQDPPYAPANGPIRFVEELLLVRGMSRELLYGDAEHEGILAYITVAGDDGMVNPNTAPLPVLLALLPGMSEENGRDLIAFRSRSENRELLASPDWIHQVGGLPADLGGDMPLLTVKSQYFAIQAVAQYDRFRRVGTGLLQRRENGEQQLLLWQVE